MGITVDFLKALSGPLSISDSFAEEKESKEMLPLLGVPLHTVATNHNSFAISWPNTQIA